MKRHPLNMAGTQFFKSLLFMIVIAAIRAAPRHYSAIPAMACGNMLSKNNENVCKSFNGGGICMWIHTSEPKCRVGRDVRAAGSLFDRSLTQLSMPVKPYNAYTAINAAKIFAAKTGNVQMKQRADERERWLRRGQRAFDNLQSPQCLVNAPLCQRVKCGSYGSQMNASQCLSDPQCCFDRTLYQYQYVFGSEFMGGAAACYYGASSTAFREVSALVKPWNPYYSTVLYDLFKEKLMKPIVHSGMSACSVVDPMKNTCGWEGISESECRLKDCCYTTHNTCVYPQNAVVEGLRRAGSYPELNTNLREETQCLANSFLPSSVYKRLPCQRLTSEPYSVLSCSAECCMDRNSISASLQTNRYLRTSHTLNNQHHRQNPFVPPTPAARQPNHIPHAIPHQAHSGNNPWNDMPQVTPDLMNMVSTIMSTDSKNSKPSVSGDPAVNLMMQIMSDSQKNPNMQPMPGFGPPSGLSGGLLEFYLKNGGRAPGPSGQRSLSPGGDAYTMMDAYMAGILGGHNAQFGQSINPNMLYYLLNSKKDGKGLDMTTMLHLGLLPFGKPSQEGHNTNPYIISALLGDKSADMSDDMKFALMQGLVNGGNNNMATAMLMSNLMKGDGSKDGSNNNKFLMMSLLSNLMNNKQKHYYPPYANNNRRSYQKSPPQKSPQMPHLNVPFQAPRVNPVRSYQKPTYSQGDMALVDRAMSNRGHGTTLPYCPYYFVRLGHFPDLTASVRGCCKVSACYRPKKMKAPTPFQKPTYGLWTSWSTCDKTCGAAAYRSRTRTCTKVQPNTRCDQPTRQFDKCKLGPCLSNGNAHQNDLLAGPRKVVGTVHFKPATKDDLNRRMERLLEQLDNPMAAPSHGNSISTPVVDIAPTISPTLLPIVPTPFTLPMGHLSKVVSTEQNGGQPFKWPVPDPATPEKQLYAYGPWSTWSMCDRECGFGRKIRMRLCSSPSGNCGNSTEEMDICNTHACENATDIPSSQDNFSTPATTPTTFTIQLPASLPPVTDVNIPSITDKAPPISRSPLTRFVYGAWSSWSSCRSSGPTCTGEGIRTRQRNCFVYLDDGTPIPQKNCKDTVQIDPCTASCSTVNIPESSTSVNFVTSETPTTTSPPPTTEEDINIPIDGNWSNWSECEGQCGENQGFSKRQRKCVTVINDPFCDTEGLVLKATKSCTVQC